MYSPVIGGSLRQSTRSPDPIGPDVLTPPPTPRFTSVNKIEVVFCFVFFLLDGPLRNGYGQVIFDNVALLSTSNLFFPNGAKL